LALTGKVLNTLGTDAILDVTSPGSYTLTAFNNVTGCSNSISVDVIDNFDIETPTLSIPNLIDCNNQTAMLGLEGAALNGYTYAWYKLLPGQIAKVIL